MTSELSHSTTQVCQPRMVVVKKVWETLKLLKIVTVLKELTAYWSRHVSTLWHVLKQMVTHSTGCRTHRTEYLSWWQAISKVSWKIGHWMWVLKREKSQGGCEVEKRKKPRNGMCEGVPSGSGTHSALQGSVFQNLVWSHIFMGP